MPLHRTIIRYYLIINRVSQPGFPTLEDLKEMLGEHDFSISSRTLQRDLENIRTDFGIEIKYDQYNRGYFLHKESSLDVDSIMKFMEMAVLTGTFNDLFKEKKHVREYISFESEGKTKGVEYISRILFALKHHRELKISYQKFADDKPYDVMVKPGLLKEYQNRWYLLCILSETNQFRAFSLDRMKGIALKERTFPETETSGIRERFAHIIGISLSDNQPQLLEITVSSNQWKYIETLPWHPSQEKIKEEKDSVTFSLYVVVNYELEQKILAEGNNICHIEPAWLAKQIQLKK